MLALQKGTHNSQSFLFQDPIYRHQDFVSTHACYMFHRLKKLQKLYEQQIRPDAPGHPMRYLTLMRHTSLSNLLRQLSRFRHFVPSHLPSHLPYKMSLFLCQRLPHMILLETSVLVPHNQPCQESPDHALTSQSLLLSLLLSLQLSLLLPLLLPLLLSLIPLLGLIPQ